MAKGNSTLWIVLGVVAVLVIGSLIFYFSKGSSSAGTSGGGEMTNAGNNNAAPSESTGGSVVTKDSSGNILVEMKNIAFNPNHIEIFVGQTVKWMNKDSVEHQIYSNSNDNEIKSYRMGAGENFTYTFRKAGTYDYHCTIHPSMKGTVIVK